MYLIIGVILGLLVSASPLARVFKRHPGLPLLFACLGLVAMTTACNPAWLSAVSAMLPSIVTLVEAIVGFAVGLNGKTISTSTLNFIQKVALDIKGEITVVQNLIATYKASPSNTTLGKISDVFSAIVASLGTILSNANISDASTVQKITQLVGIAVAAIQAVIGLIPVVTQNMTKYAAKEETAEEVQHADAQGAALVANHHKALQEGYHVWQTTPSGSDEVDAVVASLTAKI